MTWRLADSARRKRVAIFVSRTDHCLYDLLLRHRAGELACEIPLIVSNHERARARRRAVRRALSRVPDLARDQGRAGGGADRAARARSASISSCSRATCRSSRSEFVERFAAPHHQHPPLVPAGVHRRPALPPGARARREADRRHRALRDQGPRRGPDHRAGRDPRLAPRHGRRARAQGRATSSATCSRARCAGTSTTACSSTATRRSSSREPARRRSRARARGGRDELGAHLRRVALRPRDRRASCRSSRARSSASRWWCSAPPARARTTTAAARRSRWASATTSCSSTPGAAWPRRCARRRSRRASRAWCCSRASCPRTRSVSTTCSPRPGSRAGARRCACSVRPAPPRSREHVVAQVAARRRRAGARARRRPRAARARRARGRRRRAGRARRAHAARSARSRAGRCPRSRGGSRRSGRSAVVGGTGWDGAALEELARGANLLLHDANHVPSPEEAQDASLDGRPRAPRARGRALHRLRRGRRDRAARRRRRARARSGCASRRARSPGHDAASTTTSTGRSRSRTTATSSRRDAVARTLSPSLARALRPARRARGGSVVGAVLGSRSPRKRRRCSR